MNSKQKTEFRKSKEWKQFRLHLLETRGYQCEACGIKKKSGLQIHHQDEANYTNLEDDHFTILCSMCHKEIERLLKRKKLDPDEFFSNMKTILERSKSFRK